MYKRRQENHIEQRMFTARFSLGNETARSAYAKKHGINDPVNTYHYFVITTAQSTQQ